jgi:hypothetical protein
MNCAKWQTTPPVPLRPAKQIELFPQQQPKKLLARQLIAFVFVKASNSNLVPARHNLLLASPPAI